MTQTSLNMGHTNLHGVEMLYMEETECGRINKQEAIAVSKQPFIISRFGVTQLSFSFSLSFSLSLSLSLSITLAL